MQLSASENPIIRQFNILMYTIKIVLLVNNFAQRVNSLDDTRIGKHEIGSRVKMNYQLSSQNNVRIGSHTYRYRYLMSEIFH